MASSIIRPDGYSTRFCLHCLGVLLAVLNPAVSVPARSIADEALVDKAVADSHQAVSAVGLLFEADEQILIDNASAIVAQLASVESDTLRYERLKAWVRPSNTRSTVRLAGTIESAGQPDIRLINEPVSFVSPAIDLVELAVKLDCLPELWEEVHRAPRTMISESSEQQRARTAMNILILLKQQKFEEAALETDLLIQLSRQSTPANVADLWPETTVVCFAFLTNPELTADPRLKTTGLSELLAFLFSERTQQHLPPGSLAWHGLIACLAGRTGHREVRPTAPEIVTGESSDGTSEDFSMWIPSSRRRAITRGPGTALARWVRSGDRIDKISGHDDDYLFFRCPLIGDYQIDCETSAFSCQAHYAGTFFGNDGVPGFLWRGTFRNSASRIDSALPFSGFNEWIHHRIAVRNNQASVWLNGRLVEQQQVQHSQDPWFAVRSWWRMHAASRDIRISGTPRIPEEVDLIDGHELTGWYPYFEEQVGVLGGHWEFLSTTDGPELFGRCDRDLAGTYNESLLAYQRPLDQNASVDYEFYFEPKLYEVHPALDRSVFLISPDGIYLHELTDGPYDRTDRGPDEWMTLPKIANPDKPIPLRHKDWNHLRLSVIGSLVRITLNEVLVAEYELRSQNDRTFGLFHYSDQTSCRIRSVRMKGDWPRTLPSKSDQQLASQLPTQLDSQRDQLNAQYEHDFARTGLAPENSITYQPQPQGVVQGIAGKGMQVRRPGVGPWCDLYTELPLVMKRDFDVEVTFDEFESIGREFGCAMIVVELSDETKTQCRLLRLRDERQRQEIHTSVSRLQPDGERVYTTLSVLPTEASAGRLRMVRQGAVLYYLFAEHDSPHYRVLYSIAISDAPTTTPGLHLHTMANLDGETSVIWKSIRVRATELSGN